MGRIDAAAAVLLTCRCRERLRRPGNTAYQPSDNGPQGRIAGDRTRRDRPHNRSRCPLRLRAGRCRLRAERAIPLGPHSAQSSLGRWHPSSPQGVPCRRAARSGQLPLGAVPVSGTSQIFYRWRPKTCWPMPKWQNISWRTGTKGKLKARFAAVRVRTADGPAQRIRDKGQQHLPGDEAWLIGEHGMTGERKYYLANLPAGTDLRTLAATIKARCSTRARATRFFFILSPQL